MSNLIKDNHIDEIERFKNFYLFFKATPNAYKYKNLLNTLINNQKHELTILFEDIVAFDPTLAKQLKENPEKLLEKANLALNKVLKSMGSVLDMEYTIKIDIDNIKSDLLIPIEELNTSHLNTLLACHGIVIELSSEFEDNEYGYIQLISLQSLKKHDPSPTVQWGVNVILEDKYIDTIKLGDKVQITGILRIYNAHSSIPRNYSIIANNIKILNEEDLISFSEQDIKTIKAIAKEPLVQHKIAESIFKTVKVQEKIKLIGALILFCRNSPSLDNLRVYGTVSFLFVGEPGTYKTTFINTLKELVPNLAHQYNPTSDMAFTSYKSRYKIGENECEKAGLADIAKNGIILIDNLEELNTHKLSNLEQKFNIILNKSSIIAAIRTKENQYYWKTSIYNNIKLPRKTALLEKFNIVLIATHKFEQKFNGFQLDNIIETEKIDETFTIPKVVLRKYITYAKKYYHPILTEHAAERIRKFKETMEKRNKKRNWTINPSEIVKVITVLSQAYSRMALKSEIDLKDVQQILKIYRRSLHNLKLN